MLRPILITLLIYSTALTAAAQSIDTPATPPASPRVTHRAISDWPDSTADLPPEHKIQVVTLANPSKRHTCALRDVTTEAVICGSAKTPVTYQREDIAAIIDPPDHTERNVMLIPIALLVGSLAASFFVPLAWSVTLRFFSGLCLAAYGAMGDGAQGTDHNHDILLYQRPNTPLPIKLR